MALIAGTRLGSYEILAAIGAGGMGEVYRARDTKLDRDVALKILPEFFAADPDRLMRFEREAKTLASLNHPHIAQIYGIEESSGVRALVMELVDGHTVQELIEAAGERAPSGNDLRQAGKPGSHCPVSKACSLPLDEALAIARQIAEALEAAHEAGVVHRDLKPANIKVRPDGTVKVLDFGLAKLQGDGPPAPVDAMNSPTLTVRGTQVGVILGTAAYMAPEQAKGKAVDKRADIWAFGCVLYEMLSGRHAFDGETITDPLAAIVTRDPDWTALPPALPPAARQLLERCLARDPRVRLRDIGEARVLLAGNFHGAVSPSAKRGVPRQSWSWTALLLLSVIAAAAGGYFLGGRAPAPAARLLQTTFQQITDQPGLERQPTISPDGRTVVYVSEARGRSDLYSLRVGGRNAVLLTPDGRRLLFAGLTHLSLLDTQTGGVERLMPVPRMYDQWGRTVALSADGRTLVYVQSQSEGDVWMMTLRDP